MTTMTLEEVSKHLRGQLMLSGTQVVSTDHLADAIDAHLAKGAQEWRTIETAPKGEEILVYSPLCGGTKSVEDWGKFCKYNSPIWTHWMPLPAAPQPTLSAQGGVGEG